MTIGPNHVRIVFGFARAARVLFVTYLQCKLPSASDRHGS